MPEDIKIGELYHHSMGTGVKRRLVEVQDSYQYVPLLTSLQADSSVLEEIYQLPSRVQTDGLIEDVCDGELYRMHPMIHLLFSSFCFMMSLNYVTP